jgi:L-fuconolactonase
MPIDMQDQINPSTPNKHSTNYIDAHQHFWKFDPVRDSWIDDGMKDIQKDFMPADLEPLLLQNGFNGCVVVQSDQSEDETNFQLANADQYSFIKGVVGWVDLQAGNVEECLDYYTQHKKLKGFRHVLQGEAQRDLMLQPAFKKGISLLAKYGFTFDLLIFPDQLQYATELIKLFPHQPFVLDHFAKPVIKNREIKDWEKDMRTMASAHNVYCKISGMVTEADWQHWQQDDFKPYLDVVVNAFGIDRLMFGSDWPVCLVAASYTETINIVKAYFSTFTQSEHDKLFGGNAIQFYNL